MGLPPNAANTLANGCQHCVKENPAAVAFVHGYGCLGNMCCTRRFGHPESCRLGLPWAGLAFVIAITANIAIIVIVALLLGR
jgi:hypothetical protein